MSILDGEVTRPDSFDPKKNYALVIARGGEHLGDYDLIDAQRIQRYDHAVTSRLLFTEGGIQFETGGNIAPAVANGVTLGGDALVSGGTYLGIETQNYIVSIVTVGVAGQATFTWRSTGSDPPAFANQEVTIRAIALSAGAVAEHPELYMHPVGSLGVTVSFVNANGILNASSWIVQVVYGARPPLVQKATPDVGHDTITCYDIISMIAGRPHRAAAATFVVPASSAGQPTTIYGQWSRSIVTHVNDADLRDPEGDTPQAWRERWELTYTLVDTAALPYGSQEIERRVFPLYAWDRATDEVRKVQQRPYALDIGLTQGSITADRMIQVDQNEILRGLLARRTMDGHGSFVAHPLVTEGARARLSTNAAEGGKVRITLAPSVCYVEGLAIVHPDPTDLLVDQANEFAVVNDEQTKYAGVPFPLKKTIGERVFPVRNVTLLKAHVQVGTGSAGTGVGWEAHTHGTSDVLSHAEAVDVLFVAANANGTSPFVEGGGTNQWTFDAGSNSILWGSLANGTVYWVSYRYNRVMAENVDYTVTAAGLIDFSPGGVDPVTGGYVSVSYSYFLPRVDAIIVRSNGAYQVVRGIAAEVPLLPAIPPLSLRYVRVELAPSAGGPVTLRRFANDAISMEQLNRLIDAVIELTLNFAIADLHGQGQGETAGNFIDILADDFVTSDLADLTFNAGGVNAINASLIDGQTGELTVPFDPVLASPVRATSALPTGETAVRVGGTFYTLPFTDELAITSAEYSQAYSVNPYASFEAEPVQTRVVPDQDWFEDVGSRTATEIAIIRKTRALAAGLISRQDANRLIREFRERNGRNPRRGELLGALAPEVVGQTVENIPARYMRQITLTLIGTRYVPGEKIRVRFDGKDITTLVHLTAGPGSQGTGADVQAVVASTDTIAGGDVTTRGGDWQATFQIPVNVPVGTRLVSIYGNRAAASATWNTAAPEAGGYTLRDTVPYTSDGIIRTSVTQERVYDIILEPVAQSITFPEPRMISKVDVPFAEKPPNGAPPLVFEFRATDRSGQASTPVETVLEGIAMQAVAVNVGASSSNEFIPGDPVLCFPDEFRSMVLRSESNAYKIYVAMLTGPASIAGGFVQQQSVPGGIFLDSANNRDWTLHQGWDLRFTLWVAKMSGTVTGVTAAAAARIYYEQITQALTTGFTLQADQVLPDGTGIDWEYSTDGLARNSTTKVWKGFVPFVPVELGAVTSTLDFRATLRTDSLYVTPAIHQKNLSVLVTSNHTTFTYVTKRKFLTEDALGLRVKGFIEMIEAAGTPNTQTKLYVSVDNGVTWSGACTVNSGLHWEGQSADGFDRYSFDVAGTTGQQLRIRIEGGVGVTGGVADRALRPRIRAMAAYLTP